MARKREGRVKESLPRLRTLEKRFAGAPEEQRVRMLLMLKQEPERTMDEVAADIGCAPRTIKRWWKLYQEGGIKSLVDLTGRPVATQQLSDDPADPTQGATGIQRLTTSSRVERGNTQESHDEMITDPSGGESIHPPTDPTVSPLLWARLLRLLSELPAMTSVPQKSDAVRNMLVEVFDDVDNATVSINSSCPILNPDGYQPKVFVMENVPGDTAQRKIDIAHGKGSHVDRFLDRLSSDGYRFELYHQPYGIEYYYRDTAYIGIIILWTKQDGQPLSDETVATMEQLKPLLLSIFAAAAMYHQLQNPIDKVFGRALTRLIKQFKLSEQERRVVTLRLLGHSYKEMVDKLGLSIDTVKYHLKSVYTKTGTGSLAELFAKFFTPKGDIESEMN